MKFIFLDIDGVLNSGRWFKHIDTTDPATLKSAFDRECRHIDPAALTLLECILAMVPDARIVLSSSWRILFDNDEIYRIWQEAAKRGLGRELTFPVTHLIAQTPHGIPGMRFKEHVIRGREIRWWLDNESFRFFDEDGDSPLSYVIIDDDSDMLDHQRKHFVHTDFQAGLTADDVIKAVRILNGYTS